MLKTKVSWAFVFALLMAIMSFGRWLGFAASVLVVVGLFLKCLEKPANKPVLALGCLLYAVEYVRLLPIPYIGTQSLNYYINNCVESNLAWSTVCIVGAVVFIILAYINLCVRAWKGHGGSNSKIGKVIHVLLAACVVLNCVCAIASNSYFFPLGMAIKQVIHFILIVAISGDLNLATQKRNHTLVMAVILAIILAVVVNFLPGSLVGGGGGGGGSSKTCQSCGREFAAGTASAKSISRTNMCSNCYGNYNALKDFLD